MQTIYANVMLNRRILRTKAFKVIYGYAINGSLGLEDALSEMDKACEAARDLYLFMLDLIPALTQEAARRIEAARGKLNPTEAELHPNEKFAHNSLSRELSEDTVFQKLISKRKLSWEQYDIVVRRILDSICSKDYFADYMSKEKTSLKEDCALFSKIFEEEFRSETVGAEVVSDNAEVLLGVSAQTPPDAETVNAEEGSLPATGDHDDALFARALRETYESVGFRALLESLSMYWLDDLEWVLRWCCKSLAAMGKGKPWTLPELYMSDVRRKEDPTAVVDSDKDFSCKLVRAAYSGYKRYFETVVQKAPSWDRERLFSTDMAVIALAMAETETFAQIPPRVTLNEYMEISKLYCSPKSRVFINGILDRMFKEINRQ